MGAGALWVLNLDAERELCGRTRRLSPAARAALAASVEAAARALLGPGDQLVADGVRRGDRPPGRAWCPTPSARARLVRAGARPEPAPPVEVLRRVNDRAFSAGRFAALPGAVLARTRAEVLDAVEGGGGRWLLKRAFGFAGRGQRRVDRGCVTEDDRRWIDAALAEGGVAVEPRVELLGEYAWHGVVERGGALRLGRPCVQTCDASGAWLATRPAAEGDLGPDEREALAHAAHAVAGYFGPFGVDAFRWRADNRTARFHACSDVNARYTMGWATGLGLREPRPGRATPS